MYFMLSSLFLMTTLTSKSKKLRITRRDIARAAGVSLTTVTHALNAPPGVRVNPNTRARIQQIARELGYRPNFVGRALVTGKTFTIGVLQPSHSSMFSSFYQEMLLGMVRAMEPHDYHPLILFCDNAHRYMKVISQGRVDGMVVLQSDLDTSHITKVMESGIPTVVMNKKTDVNPWPFAGCVHSDHIRVMREAVNELAHMGCRNILEINDHRNCDANRLMFHGFVAATEELADQGVIGSTMIPSGTDFRRQIRSALAAGQRWDGVFVDGVNFAETFLEEAHAAGLMAGRDFHLISSSCKNGARTRQQQEYAAYTHQPEKIGEATWNLLQKLVAGENIIPEQRVVLVPYKRYAVAGAKPNQKEETEA